MSLWSQPATCMPSGCFCEAIRQGAIAQPANFWSSLTFLAVAGAIWATRGRRPFAAALAAVGVGSAFYHARLTFAGQVADIAGMYLIATAAILYGLRRRRKVSGGWYVAANALLTAAQVELPGARRFVFAALLAGVWLTQEWGVWLKRALMLFGAGAIFWALDLTRVVCSPYSFLQGHAIWHIAAAGAGWLLHKHLV